MAEGEIYILHNVGLRGHDVGIHALHEDGAHTAAVTTQKNNNAVMNICDGKSSLNKAVLEQKYLSSIFEMTGLTRERNRYNPCQLVAGLSMRSPVGILKKW